MSRPRKTRSTPRKGAASRALSRHLSPEPGSPAARSPVTGSFSPEICNDLAAAEQREWLVTNGLGGFASGTVAGSSTRRYHGLLFAALDPPQGRTLLVGG